MSFVCSFGGVSFEVEFLKVFKMVNSGNNLAVYYSLMFIIIQFRSNEASKVVKARICVQSEWINFREEEAVLISQAGNVTKFSKCLLKCGLYPKCKVINYHQSNGLCELRQDMSSREFNHILL